MPSYQKDVVLQSKNNICLFILGFVKEVLESIEEDIDRFQNGSVRPRFILHLPKNQSLFSFPRDNKCALYKFELRNTDKDYVTSDLKKKQQL